MPVCGLAGDAPAHTLGLDVDRRLGGEVGGLVVVVAPPAPPGPHAALGFPPPPDHPTAPGDDGDSHITDPSQSALQPSGLDSAVRPSPTLLRHPTRPRCSKQGRPDPLEPEVAKSTVVLPHWRELLESASIESGQHLALEVAVEQGAAALHRMLGEGCSADLAGPPPRPVCPTDAENPRLAFCLQVQRRSCTFRGHSSGCSSAVVSTTRRFPLLRLGLPRRNKGDKPGSLAVNDCPRVRTDGVLPGRFRQRCPRPGRVEDNDQTAGRRFPESMTVPGGPNPVLGVLVAGGERGQLGLSAGVPT